MYRIQCVTAVRSVPDAHGQQRESNVEWLHKLGYLRVRLVRDDAYHQHEHHGGQSLQRSMSSACFSFGRALKRYFIGESNAYRRIRSRVVGEDGGAAGIGRVLVDAELAVHSPVKNGLCSMKRLVEDEPAS